MPMKYEVTDIAPDFIENNRGYTGFGRILLTYPTDS